MSPMQSNPILKSGSLLFLFAIGLMAQTKMPPPELALQVPDIHLDTSVFTLEVKLAEGWHINSNKPADEYAIPTEVSIGGKGFRGETTQFPKPIMRFVKILEKEQELYEGAFQILGRAWKTEAKADWSSFSLSFTYQACSDQICLPPKTEIIPLAVGPTPPPDENELENSVNEVSGERETGLTPLSAKPEEKFSGPVLWVFLLLLGGGLLLNLTPCVYPLLAVTISLFGARKDKGKADRVLAAGLYVLGIVISFTALGLAAALSGKLFGSALQSPTAQIIIALIFFILALSSFGLFELRMPTSLMGKAMSASNTGGHLGNVIGGLFAGILASPCIGPFILALIVYVSQTGSAITGAWMFATLAFGMGIPYFVLAVGTGLVQKLPKSGGWMIDVKKILGVILLALAIYYLRGILGESVYEILFGILLLYIGVYINPFGKMEGVSNWLAAIVRCAAAVSVLYGAYYFSRGAQLLPPPGAGQISETSGIQWRDYSKNFLLDAKTQGQPVLIDFESKIWCAACREMEEKTYSQVSVQNHVKKYLLLKVDVDKHPDRESLLKEYDIYGIPTVVVLDGSGQEIDRIAGFVPPAAFIGRLP